MERDTVSRDMVATDVTWDEYMAQYAHDFYEWVDGDVVKMTPVHINHNNIQHYLADLFRAYFSLNPIGIVVQAPFVMKLTTVNSSREPDLQIILNTNMERFTPTGMLGPADIAIEIVSPESVERDYQTKHAEYEKGGVKEYWLIDPLKQEAHIYRRDDNGTYVEQSPADGIYTTPLLPKLQFKPALLWHKPLPTMLDIVQAVTDMMQ
ncbi:MAG: Uma2 family endonuclease [Chloroflexota bacterium]